MAEPEEDEDETPKKASKMPLILGIVLALVGGGGGFYATFSGILMGAESHEAPEEEEVVVGDLPDVAFVAMDPMTVSLNPGASSKHLRFRAHLEVPTKYQDDVTLLLPRVMDVLNGYLRALELRDLENPASLARLRAQMLRRVQIVAGEGRVNDLLIMEFVLN